MSSRLCVTVTAPTMDLLRQRRDGVVDADLVEVRLDGVADLDARYTLETADGALIYVRNRGYRHGPADVLKKLSSGEAVDPSLYYMRTTPRFETGDARYAWLNRMVCVASGERRKNSVSLEVFEIK